MDPQRRMNNSDRRQALLEKGKILFAETAFDQLRASDLSKRTGTSTGLLYHYFGSKRGYYVATMQQVADEVLDATTPPAEAALDAAVTGALAAFLAYVARNQAIYCALMRGGIGSDPEVLKIVETVRRDLMGHVVARLPGPLAAADRLKLYGWLGFVEFVVMEWLDARSLPIDALPPLLLDALLRILQPAQLGVTP